MFLGPEVAGEKREGDAERQNGPSIFRARESLAQDCIIDERTISYRRSKNDIMAETFYVYAYFEPGAETPFYVGKGMRYRSRIHLKQSHNPAVARKIIDLRLAGLEPEVKLLFFGTDDDLLVPARSFVKAMAAAGNRVELYTAEGQKHGFFNDREGTPWHASCLHQTDLFLASLGYLKGAPTVQTPSGAVLKRELP